MTGLVDVFPVPVLPRILALIAQHQHLPNAAVSAASRLRDDLDIDSLEMQSLLLSIEDGFGVALQPGDVAPLVCVADLAAAVSEKMRSAGALPTTAI